MMQSSLIHRIAGRGCLSQRPLAFAAASLSSSSFHQSQQQLGPQPAFSSASSPPPPPEDDDENRQFWVPPEVVSLAPRLQARAAFRFLMRSQRRAFNQDRVMQGRARAEIRKHFSERRLLQEPEAILAAVNDAFDAAHFLLHNVQQIETRPDDTHVIHTRKEHVIKDEARLARMAPAEAIPDDHPFEPRRQQ